jgi:hypothetical protein
MDDHLGCSKLELKGNNSGKRLQKEIDRGTLFF